MNSGKTRFPNSTDSKWFQNCVAKLNGICDEKEIRKYQETISYKNFRVEYTLYSEIKRCDWMLQVM